MNDLIASKPEVSPEDGRMVGREGIGLSYLFICLSFQHFVMKNVKYHI